MSKKTLCILISVMFLILMLPGVASARGNDTYTAGVAQIGAVRNPLYTQVQLKKLEKMVATANYKIELAVKIAQITPWNDVPQLLAKVDEIVAEVYAYANAIGVRVVCEYVRYYIDGQYVLIDPLRVIPPL